MKKLRILVSALGTLVVAGSALATPTLTISDGVTSTTISNPSGTVTYFSGGFDSAWSAVIVTGATKPVLGSACKPLMDLNIQATSLILFPPRTLTVTFSDNGFGPSQINIQAVMSGHLLSGTGQPINYSTYYDPGNVTGAKTMPLTTSGTLAPSTYSSTNNGGPINQTLYSLTQVVTIGGAGGAAGGSYSLDASLNSTVIPPVFTSVPTGGSLGCNPANAALPTDASVKAQVTGTGNCGLTSTNVTHLDGGTACASNRTFTIAINDAYSNTNSTNVVYTWTADTTPPVLACATNKTVQCGTAWDFDPPTASDVCSGTNVTISVLSTVTNGVGHITFTGGGSAVNGVVDFVSNTATSGFLDITAGTNMGTYTLSPGSGSNIAFLWDGLIFPTSDPFLDAGGLLFTNSGVELNLFGNGPASYSLVGVPTNYAYAAPLVTNGVATLAVCSQTITWTWLATDLCGNTNTCSQTVTVADTTPPVFSSVPAGADLGCNPATLPTDASVQALVTATDNCSTPTLHVTHVDSGTPCAMTRTFTVTATDACGNSAAPSTVVYTWTVHTSPPVFTNCPAASVVWTMTGALNTARQWHTATLLPNGQVLVAGGGGAGVLSSAEVYDPAPGTWTPTSALSPGRMLHTATLLANGKVLVAGGQINSGGDATTSAELYDPANGTWTATGALNTGRYNHSATLLSNGRVLVAGGRDGNGGALTSAELYDPNTGTWTTTGTMPGPREEHTATLLPNGQVLVTGGDYNGYLASTALYDPLAGTWAAAATMSAGRIWHAANLLPNGKVLVSAGWGVTGFNTSGSLSSAEIYNPATGTWTVTGSLTTPRSFHTTTLLPNGKLLVAGGSTSSSTSSAELYDAASGVWTATVAMNIARSVHTAKLLPNGQVLVAGGGGGGGLLSSAELYGPGSVDLGCNPVSIPDCDPNIKAVDSCGPGAVTAYLLVSSYVTSDVKRYNATTGASIDTFASGGGLNGPYGLVFGPDGNLYVTSYATSEVKRYNGTTGVFMDNFASGGGLNGPYDVVFGPDGNLYVSSDNTSDVKRYNGTTGAFMDSFASGGGLSGPYGLVFGPDGNLYVSSVNTSQVKRYNGTTGVFMDNFVSAGSGGLSLPYGLVFGADGNLYVSSLNTSEVKRYNGTMGAFMDNFASGGGLHYPTSLIFTPTGPVITCAKVDTTNGCAHTRTITYTATDNCGNSNTCTQVFTWKADTTPPTLTCATNKTVQCGTAWAFDPPMASGVCNGTNVNLTILSTATNGACPWVITRTWLATDLCGNTNTCSQTVTVNQAAQCVAGETWTPRESNRNWTSVASSADGRKLVAGAFQGQVYTSTDSGVTWTPRESNRQWFSVASSADGSKLVAVVSGEKIYTSTDSGVTWTARASNQYWTSLASSADGSKLVAGPDGGQIYTSTDSGVTWTPRESNRHWYSIASSADGSKLVAVDHIGLIYTSADSGVTWTPRESKRVWIAVASSSDGNKLVAAGVM
jgi:streptogramin lyase